MSDIIAMSPWGIFLIGLFIGGFLGYLVCYFCVGQVIEELDRDKNILCHIIYEQDVELDMLKGVK